MTRIVITGAAGFIGSATLEDFRKYSQSSILAIDLPTSSLHAKKGYSAAYCDIVGDAIRKYIQAGDKVLHLAALATFKQCEDDPLEALRVNIGGTLKVIEACNAIGAERLVFSSTGSVLSPKAEVPFKEDAPVDPPNFYGWTKAKCEELIRRRCKVPWVILRYGYVYGPSKVHRGGAVGAFLKLLSEGKQPTIYGGKQVNDFTFTEDIVQANREALWTENTNQLYHIGSGRANSILDVYDAVADAVGSKIEPKIEPARVGDYPVFLYDIEKARKLLGYEPAWTLKEGIARMAKLLESKAERNQ